MSEPEAGQTQTQMTEFSVNMYKTSSGYDARSPVKWDYQPIVYYWIGTPSYERIKADICASEGLDPEKTKVIVHWIVKPDEYDENALETRGPEARWI
jgi:hypothetical protein